MNDKPTILLIEDEVSIRQGLVDLFTYHGFIVEAVDDGQAGLDAYARSRYDLVIVDIMLPKVDGFTVCNEIRKQSRSQPIVILTAKTSEEDVINGLTLGADDYIGKPFSVSELVLRVKAVLRRTGKFDETKELELGKLRIDCTNLVGRVGHGGADFEFTRREVDILRYLQLAGDRPVSREELLSEVWGYERSKDIETRTVDIHIAKLRRKIEIDPKNPKFLVTHRGEGYKLVIEKG